MINKKIKALLFVCMVASIGGSKCVIWDNIDNKVLQQVTFLVALGVGTAVGVARTDEFKKLRTDPKGLEKKDIVFLLVGGGICLACVVDAFFVLLKK